MFTSFDRVQDRPIEQNNSTPMPLKTQLTSDSKAENSVKKKDPALTGDNTAVVFKASIAGDFEFMGRFMEGIFHRIRCPITQEIMKDPVVADDGFTYERDAIQAWFRRNPKKQLSPMTSLKFASDNLKPANQVKELIDFVLQNFPQGSDEKFLQVVARGSESEVEYQLLLRVNVDARGTDGRSALHIACENRQEKIVQRLLKAGANVNLVDYEGNTPLMLAVRHGAREVVKLLLPKTDVNIVNNHKETVLHFAARHNETFLITPLKDAKIGFEVANKDGNTPLLIACQAGNEVVQNLLPHSSLKARNSAGKTALHLAAEQGCHSTMVRLVNAGLDREVTDNEGNTACMLAVISGHTKAVEYLVVEKQVNIHVANNNNETALHLAARYGHLDIVKILLQAKAPLETKDKEGNTPFLLAVKGQYNEMIKFLFLKVNTHAKDKRGYSALDVAAEQGNEIIVKIILHRTNWKKETSNSSKEKGKLTPLQLAARAGHAHIVSYMIDFELDESKTTKGYDVENTLALLLAAKYGREEVVSILLEKTNVDCDARDVNGNTALHWAVKGGHRGIAMKLHAAGADLQSKTLYFSRVLDGSSPVFTKPKSQSQSSESCQKTSEFELTCTR